MPRLTFLLALVAITLAASACDEPPTSPTEHPEFSQTDLAVGTGAAAAAGNVITVDYTGWLYDPTKTDGKGPIFDTSRGRGALVFTLGVGYAIDGFELGVTGMRVGGIRRIIIPPSLGYGSVRVSAVPPYQTLVFEVELLDVQ